MPRRTALWDHESREKPIKNRELGGSDDTCMGVTRHEIAQPARRSATHVRGSRRNTRQPHGFATDLLRAPHRVVQFRRKTLLPFEPVFAKQFNGMLRADVAVSAVHRISGTVFIASPAISFGMLRVNREFLCHFIGPPRGWKTRRAVAGFAPSLILSLLRPAGRRLRQLASGFAPLAPICRTRIACTQNKTPQRSTR